MVATLLHNRIGGELAPPLKIALPECERERGRLWNDAVLEAVLALQNQLGSKNEEIVAAAANSILELERTRMRHDKTVSGTRYQTNFAEALAYLSTLDSFRGAPTEALVRVGADTAVVWEPGTGTPRPGTEARIVVTVPGVRCELAGQSA